MISAVSLGTWGHGGPNVAGDVPVGWSGHDDARAREAIVAAHRNGINHWDTADVYGNGHAEELIGSVWGAVARDEIFLATKVGWDAGPFDHPYHPAQIRRQLDRSLRNLRSATVDLYYFHHCNFGPEDRYLDDAIATMSDLRKEGKFRFLGLSDWDSKRIATLADRVDPDVVQPYRNVLDDTYESSGLRAVVDARDLGVAFFSPLKHGLLLGKYDEPVEFPVGDFRRRIDEFRDPEAIGRMKHACAKIRERFAAHPEPVLHALTGALLAGNPTATVLLGQRNRRQAEAAAQGGEPLSLRDAEWVRSLYRG